MNTIFAISGRKVYMANKNDCLKMHEEIFFKPLNIIDGAVIYETIEEYGRRNPINKSSVNNIK